MNRMRLLFLIFAWLAPGAAFCGGLVQFPEGNAAWTVEISHRGSSPQAPEATPSPGNGKKPSRAPKAVKIEVTRVDRLQRVRVTWDNGKTSDRWTVPNLPVIFEENPGAGSVTPVERGGLAGAFDKLNLPFDASAFSWLKPEFLLRKEPVSYRGRPCFEYEGTIPLPRVLDNGPQPAPIRARAWIDSETLLPVARQTENSLCIFTFQAEPPAGPLTLPPKFRKKIDNYKMVMGVP